MSFTALYDADVLYPASLRDLLVRLGLTGLFRARWTEAILDEAIGNLLRNRPDLEPERLARTRELMCQAVPDCLVKGYERLISGLELPDPDDRHVLAAAIRCHAQVIVTQNVDDFPVDHLRSTALRHRPQTSSCFIWSTWLRRRSPPSYNSRRTPSQNLSSPWPTCSTDSGR